MKKMFNEFNQMEKGEKVGVVSSILIISLAFCAGVYLLAGHLGLGPAIGAVGLFSWILGTM